MKISLETIKSNLSLLDEVKLEYPILQDYEDGKISRDSISNIGLDSFINLIEFIKTCNSVGLKPIYDEKIKFTDLKSKFLLLNKMDYSNSIFKNKTRKKFHEMWGDYEKHKRYKGSQNKSYAPGLVICEPMIINYLCQNDIEIYGEYAFHWRNIYFDKLVKPKFYSRELKMTQDFINCFIEYAKSSNLDLRKCNLRALTTELNHKLKEFTKIEEGLQVTCISDISEFEIDKVYTVIDSRINYYGYTEIKLKNDKGELRFVPYSSFEEISRKRDDILNQLGI